MIPPDPHDRFDSYASDPLDVMRSAAPGKYADHFNSVMSHEQGDDMNYFGGLKKDEKEKKVPFWKKKLSREQQRKDYRGLLDSHEKRSKAAADPFLPMSIKRKIPMFEESRREIFKPHTYDLKKKQTQIEVPPKKKREDSEERNKEIESYYKKYLGGKKRSEADPSVQDSDSDEDDEVPEREVPPPRKTKTITKTKKKTSKKHKA